MRDHAQNVLFETPFAPHVWHNFAVEVDWDALTLAVFYSENAARLALVRNTTANPTAVAGADGQGDFHFGVLKVRACDRPRDGESAHGWVCSCR